MWTTENRPRYDRDRLRYPSDLTDEEWSLVDRSNSSGQAWRSQTRGGGAGGGERGDVCAEHRLPVAIHPKDLPPRSTLHDYLTRWNYDGTIEKIHYALYVQCREAIGREASPTACVIDSQSVKSAEKGGSALIHPAMMRARRSRGSSGISWSIR